MKQKVQYTENLIQGTKVLEPLQVFWKGVLEFKQHKKTKHNNTTSCTSRFTIFNEFAVYWVFLVSPSVCRWTRLSVFFQHTPAVF